MAFDVDRFTDALMLGTKMLIAKSVEPLKAENAALLARNAALEARLEAVEARDVAAELRPQIEGLTRSVAALPGAPDLSGFVTKADLEARLAAIPSQPDLSGLATKSEVEAVREAIPAIPAPPDLSGFATKADLEALPVPRDYSPDIEELRASLSDVSTDIGSIVIPAPPDLSGFATKADLEALPAPDLSGLATKADIEVVRADIPGTPDLSGFATKADLEAVADGIPAAPDLSGYALKADLDELVSLGALQEAIAAVPAPEPVDLSGLATKEDLAEAIAEIPGATDLEQIVVQLSADLRDHEGQMKRAVEATRADIPQMPDLSGFATKADLEALPRPIDMAEVARFVGDEVAKAVAEIPPAKDGADADMPAILRHVEEAVAAAIPPKEELRGPAGRLPAVKAWVDGVHYEGDVVAHKGALYQASADTGREPPHADWVCLAERGGDGRSVDVRGTYEEGGEYRHLDIVALNGGSFIAKRDAPGPCPGDGWQLLAGRGKPGQSIKGDKGDSVKGDPGRDAEEIVGLYREGDEIVLTFASGQELRA